MGTEDPVETPPSLGLQKKNKTNKELIIAKKDRKKPG